MGAELPRLGERVRFSPAPRSRPPPVPEAARRKREPIDRFQPGGILPRAAPTISWTLPPPPPNRNLRVLAMAQIRTEVHALVYGDAESWYKTAAFEIRRAEVSGDGRFLMSALLSLEFAERAANRWTHRFSRRRPLHLFYIRSLREHIDALVGKRV